MRGEERRFSINGLELAALQWPGEGLPILALHGWLDNAASLEPLAAHLAAHHLLALDLPGHGHSAHLPPSAHYHLADNLHWIRAVADSMGWHRFVLLGHSMGAAIACVAAAAMPQRVMGLSLIDGLGPMAMSPQQELTRRRQLFSGRDATRVVRPFASLDTAARARQKHSRYLITLEAASAITERNLRREVDGYYWRYDERLKGLSTHYYSEEQVRGILGAIDAPALLISAEQGAMQGWQGFAPRCAALPGLQQAVLPGGHHVHMEHPAAVARHLNRFYATLNGDAP